jgi:hypothetical protein
MEQRRKNAIQHFAKSNISQLLKEKTTGLQIVKKELYTNNLDEELSDETRVFRRHRSLHFFD